MSKSQKKIYGIDLGTTYTSIAVVDEYGKPVIIPNSDNQHITPSVVFFDGDNVVVGEVAKENSKIYPNEVVSFIKRSMGEPDFLFEYNGKTFRAEEISSFIIRKMVQDAEQYSGRKISDVVITCPAYFGINEREATRRSGEIAGYNVRQIINEPTAAAIAYGSVETSQEKVVLVYDLGGGTFDITMIDIQSNAIEVICTGGDHNLGGKDWDDRIVANLLQEFQKATKTDEDILEDPDTCQDLLLSAEKAKKVLTHRDKTPVLITHGGERVKVMLERKKFEEITKDLLERTIALTYEMLEEAKKKGYWNYDEIVLVGGATRMPQISARIKQEFSMTPRVFDPDEAVAKGAAIYGWKLAINEGMKKTVAAKTGKKVEKIDQIKDMNIDNVLEEVEQLVAEDTGYNLADIQRSKVSIKNVTSKSFGIIAHDSKDEEVVFNLILKNTDVPNVITKTFGTAIDDQEAVSIQIMENESSDTIAPPHQAVVIGMAVLKLPGGLEADTPIDITFRMNEEGRLEITAVESTESRRIKATVETSSVISGKEFENAKKRSPSIVVS
ncbi:MAG: molecular chaperone DnaK [Desulfobacteraceae bacterium 4572_88]|nr:MAG: molecular chaperone DnaK [Desulfobacteraceae bacterium 4572_88]